MVVSTFNKIPIVCILLFCAFASGCGGNDGPQFDGDAAAEKMIQGAVQAEGLQIGARYVDMYKEAMLHDPKMDEVGSRRSIDRFLLNLRNYDAPRPEELRALTQRILPEGRPTPEERAKQENKDDDDKEEAPEEPIYRAVESMARVFKKYTPPPTPIEYLRYRTVVEVAFDSSAAYSQAVRKQTKRDLGNVIDRTWGQMWNAKVVENSWLGSTATSLGSLDPKDLVERYPHTEIDKVFFVGVNGVASGSDITCIEWDCASQTLSDVEFEATQQTQLISEAAGRAMRLAFRPLLKLYRASKTSSRIEMRVMGGEYPAPDPDAVQVKVGDAILPFLQYRKRKEKEKVERIQMLPLNYLIVERSERGRVIGPLLSAYRSPFGGKARAVQQLALRKRPRTESSVVKLVLQGRPDRPLVGHRVVVIPKLTLRDEKLDEPQTLLTDRHGQVTIKGDDRFTNFWLFIRSGEFALATVPYVPGIHQTETVAVPNDSVRLSVEGEVSLIRSRLLETVARQAVVKAKAMKLAKDGNLDEAKNTLKQLDELPGLEEFQTDINAFQVPALEKTRKGSPAYKKIVKKCSAVTTIVKRFFSEDKEKEFMQKLTDEYENSKF